MEHYAVTLYFWPPLIAGLSIGLLGWGMVLHERFSALSLAFLLLTSCVAGWLLSFSFVYSCRDETTAFIWLRIANTFVVFIPSIFYFFAASAARLIPKKGIWIFMAFVLSELFLISIWGTGYFIRGIYHYFWGYYSHYGPGTWFFLFFFFGAMAASFRLLWICHKKYGANTKRFKTLLIGFGIGYLASVDYFAAYGVPVYPLGYLPDFIFTLFIARGILRHHLVDITPSFAAGQILKTMADALLVLDHEGTVRLANEAAQHLFGERNKDLTGQKISAEGVDFFKKQNLARLLWTGGVQNHEVVYFSRLYGAHTLDISTSVIRDIRKDPMAVVCIIKDITSKKGAELALRESEKHYRILAENVTDVIWTMDPHFKLTYISPSVLKLRGYTVAEAAAQDLEKTFSGLSSKDALVAFTGMFQSLSASSTLELEYTCKDGSTVWAEVTLSVIRDEKGTAAEILGVSRNITQHRKIREALKVNENLYRDLAAAVSDPIFILDRNGILKFLNPAMEQALDYNALELAGKPLARSGILGPESEAKLLQEVTFIFLGWQRHDFDICFIRKGGGRIFMEAHPKLMRKESEDSFVQIIFKNLRQIPHRSQDQNVA